MNKINKIRFWVTVTLAAGLLSCSSRGGSSNASMDSSAGKADSVSVRSIGVKGVDSISAPGWVKAKDTAVFFAGLWVNESYVNRVRAGFPVHKERGVYPSCITIPSRTLEVTRMVGGFHDGAADLVLRKSGSGYCFYYRYNYTSADTVIPLADGRLKIGVDYFEHFHDDSLSSDDGILEQLLFAGRYKRMGSDEVVVFEENGRIVGLDSCFYYCPIIDYTELNVNFDQVKMGRDERHRRDYGFRFAGDTLMIYKADCQRYDGQECDSESLGRLLYVLPKIR